MATQHIENKLKLLPDLPGCYMMKDINSRIIYVGKAKNLKIAYVHILKVVMREKQLN